MGNDVQKCLKTNKDHFIKCNKLLIRKDEAQIDPIQKLFGIFEENTSKQAPVVQESIVLHKEVIYRKFAIIKQQQNESQRSQRSIENNQSSQRESQEQRNLKKKAWEQKFISIACSPVKKQFEINKENYTQNTYRRLRRHYFKLKGCQVKNNL